MKKILIAMMCLGMAACNTKNNSMSDAPGGKSADQMSAAGGPQSASPTTSPSVQNTPTPAAGDTSH